MSLPLPLINNRFFKLARYSFQNLSCIGCIKKNEILGLNINSKGQKRSLLALYVPFESSTIQLSNNALSVKFEHVVMAQIPTLTVTIPGNNLLDTIILLDTTFGSGEYLICEVG